MGISMPTVEAPANLTPLAAALRPRKLDEILGQQHLLGPDKLVRRMAIKRQAQSAIIWGPPGTGKTSLVRALSNEIDAAFFPVNATNATVKDLREIIAAAKVSQPRQTFVFIDEIHRFSKSQQDVLLPVVEDGTIIMFGATVEKPKFAVNSTILSRCMVLETKPLDAQAMIDLIKRVKDYYKARKRPIKIEPEAAKRLIVRSSGDARKVIMAMETAIEILADHDVFTLVTAKHIDNAIPDKHVVFDASGNDHYDLAHCYQEAIQNSDVDGALYWLGKWIASGEDPAFICRRMLITAFEDCAGNPFAWVAAVGACYTVEKTGLPECMIPMSLATCEMAKSERNKSAYHAIKEVMADIEAKEIVHVPPGLRAGTSGYVHAIKKKYLKGWKRDTDAPKKHKIWGDEAAKEYEDTIVYAMGHKDRPNSYGMINGPTPVLEEMLELTGGEDCYIIQFDPGPNGEHTNKECYRWDVDSTSWVKL